MNLALVLLIPVAITVGSFVVFKSITWREAGVQLGACLLLLLASWQIAKWSGLSDTQILNGRITEKVHGTQKCCHCHDVCVARNKDGQCVSSVEVCSHSYDHYWDLRTSVGTIGVDSCEGWNNPPVAWVNAYVGEPASAESSYQNYLLADPDSLFVHGAPSKYLDAVPPYPRVHELYTVDHVITDGPAVPPKWQAELRELNADLGYAKQVDVTVLLTKRTDPVYAQSVEQKWLYGPKNSLTIVLGVKDDTVAWARVVSFSRVEALKVKLRDALQGKRLDDASLMPTIRKLVASDFHRTAMAEFEYLAQAAEPKGWGLFVIALLQFLASIGLAVLMHREDVFNEERFAKWRTA